MRFKVCESSRREREDACPNSCRSKVRDVGKNTATTCEGLRSSMCWKSQASSSKREKTEDLGGSAAVTQQLLDPHGSTWCKQFQELRDSGKSGQKCNVERCEGQSEMQGSWIFWAPYADYRRGREECKHYSPWPQGRQQSKAVCWG